MNKRAIFAFSADPVTFGHKDVIQRASKIFDQVIVGVGTNPAKKYLFHSKERLSMVNQFLTDIPNATVVEYPGLLVNYAYRKQIPVIIKGARNAQDFDYERLLHEVGESQKLGIDTCVLFSKQRYSHVSSSTTKAIQMENGLISEYVPLHVKQYLEARLSGQYIVGVTGEIGCGKSFVCKQLEKAGALNGIPVHNIELDHLGHKILSQYTDPVYQKVRDDIVNKFGINVRENDGTINRKALGRIVFNDKEKLDELNAIMKDPLQVALLEEIRGKRGLILVNAALIAEFYDMSKLCNHNVVVITADKGIQQQRLRAREYEKEQISRRSESQFDTGKKLAILERNIEQDDNGFIIQFDTTEHCDDKRASALLDQIVRKVDVYAELRHSGMWNRIGADGEATSYYQKLCSAYLDSNRFYHSLGHIVDGVNKMDDIRGMLDSPDRVLFAWFYHDLIMKKKSKLNEELSAQAATNICREVHLPVEFAESVKQLIMHTKHCTTIEAMTNDAKYLTDVDLSILGENEAKFSEYEEDIRREYAWVPDNEFNAGRLKVLSSFLNRDRIYSTQYFFERYEQRARANIERVIKVLS